MEKSMNVSKCARISIFVFFAVTFFVSTLAAGELSPGPDKLLNSGNSYIRLAKAATDKPQKPGKSTYDQTPEVAMEEVLQTLDAIQKDASLSPEEKKKKCMEFVKNYRYGPEKKHYFWINDLQGTMLMDPVNEQLNGHVVTNIRDATGKLIFVDFINICLESGGGYVNYLWPEPGMEKPVAKISLVKLFKKYGWVVGTGLYLKTIEAYDMPVGFAGLPPIGDTYSGSGT
ncbi:MAG: cache domain-containing protein [Deltaproteobacteria bacterium]|nr:cache domain-containing protein [Deltaproteobacteria bacterium]MBW1737777.1 cache domain-containing protein [Deltaproteobacteria bacterium]MBW1910126.1 cache domain-containing protein [Deltaproteobacteria bacterium]MBW2032978.1 cache domain-containing protein [Deltaproteobacteria bacterium]MBW2115665.1 cache domain-containing protein [Deltaproteobacteria bacterium]